MICRGCAREFHLCDVIDGMGYPSTPGTLLVGGVALTLLGIGLSLLGWWLAWVPLLIVGLSLGFALPLAVSYIPDSVSVYRANKAGHCPGCGLDNGLRFWSR